MEKSDKLVVVKVVGVLIVIALAVSVWIGELLTAHVHKSPVLFMDWLNGATTFEVGVIAFLLVLFASWMSR